MDDFTWKQKPGSASKKTWLHPNHRVQASNEAGRDVYPQKYIQILPSILKILRALGCVGPCRAGSRTLQGTFGQLQGRGRASRLRHPGCQGGQPSAPDWSRTEEPAFLNIYRCTYICGCIGIHTCINLRGGPSFYTIGCLLDWDDLPSLRSDWREGQLAHTPRKQREASKAYYQYEVKQLRQGVFWLPQSVQRPYC